MAHKINDRFKGTPISYFEDDVYPLGGSNEYGGNAGGEYRYDYFKKVRDLTTITTDAKRAI